MALTHIPIVSWAEAKAAMDAGRKAYWVDCGDFWDIMVVDAPVVTCEIMKAAAFAEYPEDVTRYFDAAESADFELNYQPRLIEGCKTRGEN